MGAPVGILEVSSIHVLCVALSRRIFSRSEFQNEADALNAWEEFLRVSKGDLTASEIAKIRDHVGVVGMAGT